MAKLVIPVGDHASLTVFANHEYNYFHFEDSAGPGETWEQEQVLGKNFSMTNDPHSEHYEGFNYELKRTDFEYIDLKDQVTPSFSFEEQPYTYFYANHTHSTNDLTGVVGPDLNGTPAINGAAAVANTSVLQAPGANKTDIGGYDKLNEYRVLGDIVRFTQDWSFGTLKWGGLIEGSRTFRHNCFIDDSTGFTPDNKFSPASKFPLLTDAPTNCKLLEESSWLQGQIFADFYLRPTENLTITPGFKYVDFHRNVNAANENVAGAATKNQPLVAHNTYSSPLYFLTANYKIQPYWSVYGQFATSFLIPQLADLYATGANVQNLQSEYTTNYQTGTVYTRGPITADADVYLIEATNLQVSCSVPDASLPTGVGSGFCNAGKARFDGVEGEFAYALPIDLTLLANASWNQATQLANAANPSAGIAANPRQELAAAPEWTDAFGAVYGRGPWRGSLTFKQVGSEVQYNTPAGLRQITFHVPSYFTLDGSVGYDFGHVAVKLQAFNLLDQRQITGFTPGANSVALRSAIGAPGSGLDTGLYTFQAGRQVEVTLIGKF